MSIINWWRNLTHPVATRLNYFRVHDSRVLEQSIDQEPAAAEETYFQISVLSMHLAHEERYFSDYIPGIAAVVTETLAGGTREYIRVAGASDLAALEASRIGRTITINKAVSPLIPFSGGSVEVILGLVAFRTSDALPGLLELVSDVSGLIGGPAAAAAADTVGSVVAKGFQTLLGTGDRDLKLALEHRFDGAEEGAPGSDALVLREGFWVLLNEESRTRDDLWLKDGQLMTGPVSTDLEALAGVDYMVLRIDTRATRDDWRDFCRDELDRRDVAAVEGDHDEAVAQNKAAKAKIINSRLFTRSDKRRRVAELTAWEAELVASPSRDEGDARPQQRLAAAPEDGEDLWSHERLADFIDQLR